MWGVSLARSARMVGVAAMALSAMVLTPALADTGEAKIRINVREGMGTSFPIVVTLNQGQPVEILEYDGEFAKVETAGGNVGYLKSKYLNIAEDITPTQVIEQAMNDDLGDGDAMDDAMVEVEVPEPVEVPEEDAVAVSPTPPVPVSSNAADDTEAVQLGAVVVTGSRILREELTANSPITVFEADTLKFQNTANIEEFLRDMPQFVAAFGANTNNGNPGVATVDLRNLGEERTLVLVDGKRFTPYDADGAVDLSMIPVSLIERVEVITGGASAVYGSDAVAGVVNFILKRDFEGVEGDYSYQVTGENDGDRTDLQATLGGNIVEGRGNVVMNFGYTEQKGVTQGDRGFSQSALDDQLEPFGSFTTPWGTLIGNFPSVDTDDNGLVQFDQQGNSTLVGTADTFNFNPFNLLQTPQEKWTATALANLEVTERVSAFSRLSLANSRVDTIIAPTGTFFFPFKLNVDNPFLSEQAQGVFADQDEDGDGLVDVTFGRRLVELGTRDSKFENTTFQLVGGLEGVIDDIGRWEVFGQIGRTSRVQNFLNDVNFDNAQQAMRAVENDQGEIVCSDPSGGCAPGNFFGPGLLSAEAADFIRLNIQENNKTEQRIFGGSLAGPTPFFLPLANSPVAYAVGVEVRQERSEHRPDANYEAGNAIGFGSS